MDLQVILHDENAFEEYTEMDHAGDKLTQAVYYRRAN
jgi:hypothetical protein